MVIQAILVFLVMWFTCICQYHMPNIMGERAIFVGFLTGLVLGDVRTGIIIGAQLELVFMGVVYIGSSTSADVPSATALAVAFAIMHHMSNAEVIALGTTLGYAGSVLITLEPMLGELFTPILDKQIEKDNYKMFTILGFGLSFIEVLIRPIIVLVAVLFGGEMVTTIMASLPAFVLTGINAAGTILPAVGLGILASLLWNKKYIIYFILGFFLIQYLNIPTMFLAIIAAFVAINNLLISQNSKRHETMAEEDFFG